MLLACYSIHVGPVHVEIKVFIGSDPEPGRVTHSRCRRCVRYAGVDVLDNPGRYTDRLAPPAHPQAHDLVAKACADLREQMVQISRDREVGIVRGRCSPFKKLRRYLREKCRVLDHCPVAAVRNEITR